MVQTGIIKKAHGVKGEVVFVSDKNSSPRPGELCYAELPGGDLRPLRAEQVRPSGSSKSSFFVLFFGIDTRTQAEELRGLSLYSDAAADLKSESESKNRQPDIFDSVSYQIVDTESGLQGRITDVTENPAHPILHADINGTGILIPYAEAWISEVDHQSKKVTGINLADLIELAENS